MKEFKVEIPEGYEIDKEKSTFEKIVFKKKEEVVNCWEDIKRITGYWINMDSEFINYTIGPLYMPACDANKNVFLNEKYAKSALAFAQISQLLPYYDSNVKWDGSETKYCISRYQDTIIIDGWGAYYHPIAFNTQEEAERFLKHNEQLVKDYYMID